MQKVNPKVSIIIANYNGERYLKTCLSSILKSDYKNFEIIIVDDCSSDDSNKIISKFKKLDERVVLFQNEKNLGAAGTRNFAISKAIGDVLIFIDNDTEVEKQWIDNLLITLKNKKVGAAQSLLLDFIDREKIQMAGGRLIPQVGWLWAYHAGSSYKTAKKDLDSMPIVAISACLAVKREVIETVKGFDVEEAVTTEDLDFCWRIWIAGYEIRLSPSSIVYHHTKRLEERDYIQKLQKVYFHLAKNSFRSIIKNYQGLNVFKYLLYSMMINFGRGIVFLIFKRNEAALIGSSKALLWNVSKLGNTLNERKTVNKYRKFEDKYLINKIMVKENFFTTYNEVFKK